MDYGNQNCSTVTNGQATSDASKGHMNKIAAKHVEMNQSAQNSPHANVQNDTKANDYGDRSGMADNGT